MDGHAPPDLAVDGTGLVFTKIMAGLRAQQAEDLLHRTLGFGRRGGGGSAGLAESVLDVGDEPGRHLGRRQLVVHQAGGDGAAWHPVEFARFGVLRHGHAALTFDGPHAQGAVAAGAGKHDADGLLALVLGQGAKEEVDRQSVAARLAGFQ